jgi:hypothetical protein
MKIKTSDLTLLALNWAVAQAEGDRVFRPRLGRPDDWDGAAYRAGDTSDERWIVRAQVPNVGWFADYAYNPSTSWAQGGPIIEREGISLDQYHDFPNWAASCPPESGFNWFGPTQLIAAMRCFVASKLGDEVEVPEELL